jgi:hypothetical protein
MLTITTTINNNKDTSRNKVKTTITATITRYPIIPVYSHGHGFAIINDIK